MAGAVSTLNGCMGLLANVVLPGTSVAAPLGEPWAGWAGLVERGLPSRPRLRTAQRCLCPPYNQLPWIAHPASAPRVATAGCWAPWVDAMAMPVPRHQTSSVQQHLTAAMCTPPADTNAQSAAAVLFAWAMVGWLLPSLLLLGLPKDAAEARLPPTPANSPLGDSMGDACTGPAAGRWTGAAAAALAAPSAAATWVEAALRGLVGRRRQQVPAGQDTSPAGLPLALRWVLCLQIVWLACRAAAPLPFAR